MSDDIELHRDPPNTLFGQLQRGRGAGFLWALREDPATVQPLLIECITHDPRLDGQVESREDYYARLAHAVGLDLTPLDTYLHQHDDQEQRGWNTPLTIEVLGALAILDHVRAVSILREYVRYGTWFDDVLEELSDLNDPSAIQGLDDVICSRFNSGAALLEIADRGPFYLEMDMYHEATGIIQVWRDWRSGNLCIARLLDEAVQINKERDRTHRGNRIDLKSYSIEALLTTANVRSYWDASKVVMSKVQASDHDLLVSTLEQNNVFAWFIALKGLEKLGLAESFYSTFLQRVRVLLEPPIDYSNHERVAANRILRTLPAEVTLDLARSWFTSSTWELQNSAEHILSKHATLQDVRMLKDALQETLARDDPYNTETYRIGHILDALACVPGVGPIPEVEQVFVETTYSYHRVHAAQTMSAIAPEHFAQHYAFECLWDCEYLVRQLAVRTVDSTVPEVAERLRLMATDPLEDKDTRTAAAERL